jgi:DNA-binding NarL/FixJ family response regulator
MTTADQNGIPARRSIGVLVIDPTPLYREGLASLIARTPGLRLLGATGNVGAAVALCDRTRPDLVVVDSVLDPRSQLTQLLVGGDSRMAVLSVVREPLRTARYVASALSTGASGVVPRSAEPARMIEAIRRTYVHRRYLDPELAVLGPAPTGPGARGQDATGQRTGGHIVGAQTPLSRREHQVLELIANGLENQEIAKQLFVSVETIRTHVKGILRKLCARDRAHAVAAAYQLGVLVPDPAGEPIRPRPARRGTIAAVPPVAPPRSAPATVSRGASRAGTCRGYQAVI